MSDAPELPRFDRKIADHFLAMNERMQGLPGYLGVRFVRFEAGYLRAEMQAREELLTPFGTLHGGVLAGLVDHVLGCVAYPLMQPGQWAATTEFKLNYLAPVREGTLAAESRVLSMTRTTGVVAVEVRNEDRLVAVAQGTLLVRDPKPKPAP